MLTNIYHIKISSFNYTSEKKLTYKCIKVVKSVSKIEEFNSYREKMNEIIMKEANLGIKRFFALDARTYSPGTLSSKIKELLGLVASLVLRCNDCITYHTLQCHELGVSKEEFYEAFNVALIVGGSIVIPHLRKAIEILEECYSRNK